MRRADRANETARHRERARESLAAFAARLPDQRRFTVTPGIPSSYRWAVLESKTVVSIAEVRAWAERGWIELERAERGRRLYTITDAFHARQGPLSPPRPPA